jgi:O-methyltransferase
MRDPWRPPIERYRWQATREGGIRAHGPLGLAYAFGLRSYYALRGGLSRRIRAFLARRGFEQNVRVDFEPNVIEIMQRVSPYTLTPPDRIEALCSAVGYIARAKIPGAIVECGVWRGGSVMAAALELLRNGDSDRDLYLYDTFVGMTAPSDRDVDHLGNPCGYVEGEVLMQTRHSTGEGLMAEVRRTIESTGYPPDRIHLVEGRVEETLPEIMPQQIALLRLDTDWYESTRHELEHLYPRLASGGVLIADDYGEFRGAREAVDEFFSDQPVLLHRVDSSARVVLKR